MTGSTHAQPAHDVSDSGNAQPQVPEMGFSTRSTPLLLARRRARSAKIPGRTGVGDEETLGPLKLNS